MKVRIGYSDAQRVGRLLRQIGRRSGLPEELRSNASLFASAVRGRMERQDLQAIAWILEDACSYPRLPIARREEARFWASYLRERV
jgi:hypothetical protein